VRPDRRRLGLLILIPATVTALLATTAVPASAANNTPCVPQYTCTPWNPQTIGTPWDPQSICATANPNSPNNPNNPTTLKGIAAVSTSEVWTVGQYTDAFGILKPELLRINGTTSQQVATPLASAYSGSLTAVDATATTNAWATGWTIQTAGGIKNPVMLKRSGGVWQSVALPSVSAYGSRLNGIDMVSPTSGWAVGAYNTTPDGTSTKNLILRWDGTSWTQADASIAAPGYSQLYSVTADGSNVWAVGGYSPSEPLGDLSQEAILLRWNGGEWAKATLPPSSGSQINLLRNIVRASPTEIWAMGTTSSQGWIHRHPLILRSQNNGDSWDLVPPPADEPLAWEFTDAYVKSPAEVYFVGYRQSTPYQFDDHDFIRRWNGSALVSEPLAGDLPDAGNNSGRVISALSGIAGLPTGELWVSGHKLSRCNQVLVKNVS
jgi:hypothetical protein